MSLYGHEEIPRHERACSMMPIVTSRNAAPISLVNWGHNQRSQAAAWVRPRNQAEVQSLVIAAGAEGRQLKVVGAAHSWSDIAMSPNSRAHLVSLDAMTGVIAIEAIDDEHALVDVWAGTRLHQLNQALAAEGWAMPILGSVAEQSLAGAVATGTHGSSIHHGNLSTLIESITLVDGQGHVRHLQSKDELDLARVSLGALGIFTRLRLRVCKAFNLSETLTRVPWEDARSCWRERLQAAPYLKIWWLPPSDDLLFFEYSPTSAPPTVNRLASVFDDKVTNPITLTLLLKFGALFPATVAPINRLIHKMRFGEGTHIDRSDRRFTLAMPPVHREVEYSLALEQAFDGLDAMRELVRDESIAINFIQELRFVKGDNGYLSPAQGRDSAQLGAYMAESPHRERYFRGFEDRMRALGGRPHWGKEFTGLNHHEISALWPQAREFARSAREYDPQGIFTNDFLQRVLGPR